MDGGAARRRPVRIVGREGEVDQEGDWLTWFTQGSPFPGRPTWQRRVVQTLAWTAVALCVAGVLWGWPAGFEGPESRAYARRVDPHDRAYAAAALAFARLHRELATRPSVPDDDTWRRPMADALDSLDRAAAAMAAAGPAPRSMQTTATLVDGVATDTRWLVREYAAAVDTVDRDRAVRAADRMAVVQERRSRVRRAVDEAMHLPSNS